MYKYRRKLLSSTLSRKIINRFIKCTKIENKNQSISNKIKKNIPKK